MYCHAIVMLMLKSASLSAQIANQTANLILNYLEGNSVRESSVIAFDPFNVQPLHFFPFFSMSAL